MENFTTPSADKPVRFKDSIYHQILKDNLALIKNGVQDLGTHFQESLTFLQSIPDGRGGHAYAPGKWTITEVIGHLLDARIVFLNRLLYVVREEKVALLPFDEGLWTAKAGYRNLNVERLSGIYAVGSQLIQATVDALPSGALSQAGIANGVEITGEEILLFLMAHEIHHFRVIAARYLDHAYAPGK